MYILVSSILFADFKLKLPASPGNQSNVEAEASRIARNPLYDIPLAPSARFAPLPAPANPGHSFPEVYDLTGSDGDDAMDVDIYGVSDNEIGHGGEDFDEDADTVYHSGGDNDSDNNSDDDADRNVNDRWSSSEDASPARVGRSLPPAAFNPQVFINQDNYGQSFFVFSDGLCKIKSQEIQPVLHDHTTNSLCFPLLCS